MHTETKNGSPGMGREKVRQVGEAIDRFTADTAAKTGISERVTRRDAECGMRISDKALAMIRGYLWPPQGQVIIDAQLKEPAMVQSKATSVDEWFGDLAASDQPIFEKMRAACIEELAGWDERMQWGMPGYGPPARDNAVSYNAQKRHIAFYAGPTAIEQFREQLAGIDCGKGCVRYRSSGQIDFALLRAMLRVIYARASSNP